MMVPQTLSPRPRNHQYQTRLRRRDRRRDRLRYRKGRGQWLAPRRGPDVREGVADGSRRIPSAPWRLTGSYGTTSVSLGEPSKQTCTKLWQVKMTTVWFGDDQWWHLERRQKILVFHIVLKTDESTWILITPKTERARVIDFVSQLFPCPGKSSLFYNRQKKDVTLSYISGLYLHINLLTQKKLFLWLC